MALLMKTEDESLLPYRIMEEQSLSFSLSASSVSSTSSENHSNPSDAVIFFGLSLALGIACRHLLRGTRVPYTVALLILGIALGSLEYGTHHRLGKIGDGIRLWSEIDPELLLAVFLPALLFESSFSMEVHQIKRCIAQMILLAGPGVVISTVFLGSVLKLTFPYNWSWKTSLLLGGLLSATDPVAVVALLKDLGASKKLSTIIEGESLMNDGTAIVVYTLFYRMVLGETFNSVAIIKFLAQVSLGAVGIGIAFGIASVLWLGFIFNDTVIEISLTLAVSYIAYYTAQESADVSGVLTVMSLGMFYSAFARTAFKGESQQSLHHFCGVVIAEGVLSDEQVFHHGKSWVYLFLLYAYVQVSRCIVVGTLFPLLRYFGYGLDWKEAIILIWSGLRGAVALSLSLSFVFFTGGIVFLTLIVNGSTTQFILHFLQMNKLSSAKSIYVFFYPLIIQGERVHPHGASESDSNLDPMNLKDIRVRLLNGVQAAYWEMLDEGRITQTTANILMLSVEESIDLSSTEPLCDWKGLKSNVHFPSYYKFLQSSMLPPKLVTYFTVERLESACYICAAFLRAHRIARQQLHDFIGDSDIASAVINESVAEGEEARKFLEDVNLTYPQVLRVVKTRQATYVVLNHLLEYVQDLEKSGILEEKEMLHLHDAVQTDLKKLLRNPPLVKLPKISNINPMLDALPSSVRGPLVSGSKETMKLRGLTLYKEGAKSNDSIVFCHFIEANKIISCLKSDPSMEDFLWQESAIFLSKLLLPQTFEKLTMQDLRALIAERSEMTIYIRGETIEIPYHSVAFLLEGYIKTQGSQELVTAPAALVPLHGNRSFQNLSTSGSFIHQGSCYVVETRARVIVFDIAAFEPDTALVKKSSSRLSHTMDHSHRSFLRQHSGRQHSGLMSWPEHFYAQSQHKQSSEQQSNSLSARAMHLSIYGSMVDIPLPSRSLSNNRSRPPPQSLSYPNFAPQQVRPPQSLSYPTFVPHQGRPLVSVKSEGAATDKENIGVMGFMQDVTNLPSQSTDPIVHHEDDSSDDSAIEEDIIVRIDSPSTLSFRPS
ncbi:hypothetical protein TSUD_83030 [Trifolium subterraneum]|uniref:Cation/H+ exchanger transmembrane domain-containing protein n=1 Tax=Trifolium subterraneum TaxID=3900 RepID=A0A2Z6LHL4_TRISU|nr:hypothetical protein TSUD_83030 [Trifolium subterraneum]